MVTSPNKSSYSTNDRAKLFTTLPKNDSTKMISNSERLKCSNFQFALKSCDTATYELDNFENSVKYESTMLSATNHKTTFNSCVPKEDSFVRNVNELKASNKISLSLNDIDHIKKKEKSNKKNKLRLFSENLQARIMKKFNHLNFFNQSRFERLIEKHGDANVIRINIQKYKFLTDFFNTIVDLKWRYILLIFSLSFLFSWTFFTILWYFNSKFYYEFYSGQCISGLNYESSFYEFYLFSIETQQTIGYGSRYVTNECQFSVIILMCQCGINIFLECFLGGVLFAKLSRPNKRTETLGIF